ncbi:MAG: NDP-sugar synthase [Acidobacteriota bacterium]
MKAMILAAGFGNRLWPLTQDRAKPAIPFLGRPLIAHSVELLKHAGITDITVNLHYQGESIKKALGDGSRFGVNLDYSEEAEILGTAGGIDKVREKFLDDDFVVINGKIVTDVDLQSAIRAHRERQAIATLVLKENVARERFSIIEVDERNYISRFAGFPQAVATAADSQSGATSPVEPAPLMFVSIHILSPRIFNYIPRHGFSDTVMDVYPAAMRAAEAVIGHIATGHWYEFSTLTRYLELSLALLHKDGKHMVQGANCQIADSARVSDSILWDNVTVEAGARVQQAVLAEGVRIPAGAHIERAVVVRREIINRGVEERQRLEIANIEEAGENIIVHLK